MKRRARLIGLALVFALVIVALFIPSAVLAKPQYVLKMGHVLSPSEPIHQAALWWAEEVKERTNGQVEIQVYPSSQLGNNRDTYEQAKLGAPISAHADPAYLGDYIADFAIMNGPYIYQDWEDAEKLVKSDWFADLTQQLIEKESLRILAFNWVFGQRHIISDRPLQSPADMKGLKFRVPPNTMWRETIAAMGATPTPLEWSEVYSGLAQGVVDGAEAPLSTLYGSKLHEVKKVITLTGHFKALTGVVIGETYWQMLPADIRKIIQETAWEAGELATEMVLANEEKFKKILEDEGVTFYEADVEAFTKATEVVYTKFPDWTPGLHNKVLEMMRP